MDNFARLIIGIVLLVFTTAASAQFQPEDSEVEAKAMFAAGKAAFDAGRYQDALERWDIAYGLSGRPALHWNRGLAYERLNKADKAIEAFRNYLKWPNTPQAQAEDARARIAALESDNEEALQPEPAPLRTWDPNAPEFRVGDPYKDEVPAANPYPVPSPQETANTTQADYVSGSDGELHDDGTPWYQHWAVWTGVGVAVVAGILMAVLIPSSDVDRVEPASGVSIEALRGTL